MHDQIPPLSRRRWLAYARCHDRRAGPRAPRSRRRRGALRTAVSPPGQPRERSIVLWTRLTGPDLPPQVSVRWELARDEGFTQIAARGTETATADEAHSVHAEPSSARTGAHLLVPLRGAGPAQREWTHAAPRRRPMPLPTCASHWPVASASITATTRRGGMSRAPELDFVLFVGDYIYEYPSPPVAVRYHEGGAVRTLEQYRARYAQYKSDPALQAAHAAMPWLLVWDDHEVDNDYANLQGQNLQTDFREQRAAAYRAYWEHMPFPKALRPSGPDMRIYGRYDWGSQVCIHALDDRQYRDVQACAKTRTRRLQRRAPGRLPRTARIHNARCSAPRESAGLLTELGSAAALEPARAADR